eukprot:1139852-Pelagomonas_calceolata.AAC.5
MVPLSPAPPPGKCAVEQIVASRYLLNFWRTYSVKLANDLTLIWSPPIVTAFGGHDHSSPLLGNCEMHGVYTWNRSTRDMTNKTSAGEGELQVAFRHSSSAAQDWGIPTKLAVACAAVSTQTATTRSPFQVTQRTKLHEFKTSPCNKRISLQKRWSEKGPAIGQIQTLSQRHSLKTF